MYNVELKARRRADVDYLDILSRIGAKPMWTDRQEDAYFLVPSGGRLKLRLEGKGRAELIYYERPNAPGMRESEYVVATLVDAPAVSRALSSALGVSVRVCKHRTLYRLEEVRIHLDDVEGLGDFIEFEAPVPLGASPARIAEAREAIELLQEAFGVRSVDIVAESYADLLGGVPDGPFEP